MPRFAANLSLMYAELPFLDRFAAAARDGFVAVEYLFPYAWPAAELAARLRGNGLRQVLFNAPPGGRDDAAMAAAWAQGQRGTACLPGRQAEFRQGVRRALAYAAALDCPRIHLMAGLVPADSRRADVQRTYLANLRWAAAQAAAVGCQVLIEPINLRDMPGYYLHRQSDAHAVVQQVGAPNLKVQMDLYHCQISEGDLATQLRQHLPSGRVGHLQIAGVPGRHEPDGQGEINYPWLLAEIDRLSAACGWQGWVGCEYRPRAGTSAGLGWFKNAA